MLKQILFYAQICGIGLVWLVSLGEAQNSQEQTVQNRADFYSQAILGEQNQSITRFGDAAAEHLIEIAESAISKLYTSEGKPSELRSIARTLDSHLIELLSNDTGRWIATNTKSVRLFIGFDSDSLLISDRGIVNRAGRLSASAKALRDFNSTQGKFDPSKSEAVRSILVDSNWVNDMRSKIRKRLSLVEQLIASAPKSGDFKDLPTLAEVKRQLVAKDAMEYESAMQAVKKAADQKGQEQELEAEFKRRFRNASAETAAKDVLADFNRQLLETEYSVKQAVVQSKIRAAKSEREKIEAKTLATAQAAQEKLLVAYLTSPRVKRLLSPFCEPGMTPVGAWNKNFKIDELDPRPISLSKLATYRKSAPRIVDTLKASRPGVSSLVRLANTPHNDRPPWPTTHDTWESAGNTFKDMNGNMVNPYREAQRILREHGPVLVELKMLVK